MWTDLERQRLVDHAAYGTPVSEEEINERFLRVNGDAICTLCGRTYKQHPTDGEVLKVRPQLILVHLCDGTLGKL